MMFHDGYSRKIVLTGSSGPVTVVYRPATANERICLRNRIRMLNSISSESVICQFMADHVVEGESPVYPDKDAMRRLDNIYPEMFETLRQAINGSIPDSTGRLWAKDEPEWRRNLYQGIVFERQHPRLAARPCDLCQKLWYNETTGLVILKNSTQQPELRIGPPPCRTQTGCAKGTPEEQKSLSLANRWAVLHFRQCKAVGRFPEDAIVMQNAEIISRAMSVKISKSSRARTS